ncbi:MAG: hypothetical protein LUB59_03770 [Candidatus Gastranaerophilales bacterium]|nr:hypothetical protein [Candidatus Gastranaerophilales bacterium]
MTFGVDELQLYFGDDYKINDHITIHQPTVGEIVAFGEQRYFGIVHAITCIPSDMKSRLDDLGIDWTKISDYELFLMIAPTLKPEDTSILFGDLDFTKLKQYINQQNNKIVLADMETGLIVDEMIYLRIVDYLRKVHGIKPKVERYANKITKKVLIEEERTKLMYAAKEPFKSYLLPMISCVKVRMGYTKDYIRNEGYYEFNNDLQRLCVIINTDQLMAGCYAGTVDMKKINKKELNWMREL